MQGKWDECIWYAYMAQIEYMIALNAILTWDARCIIQGRKLKYPRCKIKP